MITNDGLWPIILKNAKTNEDIILQPGQSISYSNKYLKDGFTYVEIVESVTVTDGLYETKETVTPESSYTLYLKG